MAPSLYLLMLFSLLACLVERSYTSPAPRPNTPTNNLAFRGEKPHALGRRQIGAIANAISSIPPGELNEIFSGSKKSQSQSDDGFNCQIDDKTDSSSSNGLTACWGQYQNSNGTAGLRCGGKGWYRGQDKGNSNPICQQICSQCLQNAVTAGAEKVSCAFGTDKSNKCWTGYH